MAGVVSTPSLPISGRITPLIFPFFTTGEDNLRLYCSNALAGVQLVLNGRTVGNDGQPKPLQQFFTPTSDRVFSRVDIPLTGDTILNISVAVSQGKPAMGQTFALVQLIRGTGAAAQTVGTILSGCITDSHAVGWPGSPIVSPLDGNGYYRAITGTTPLAGAEVNEVVPTGARWELITVRLELATSAVAGVRKPLLLIFNTINTVTMSLNTFMNPSTTYIAQLGQTWPLEAETHTAFNYTQAPLPQGMNLLAGWSFQTTTENLQNGDQWSAPIYLVREWLEP